MPALHRRRRTSSEKGISICTRRPLHFGAVLRLPSLSASRSFSLARVDCAMVKAIFGTNELFSLFLSFLRSYSRNPDPNYEEKSRSAAAAARIKFPHAQRKRRRRRLRLPTPKLKCPLWSNRTRGISTTVDGRNSDVVTAKWEEERLEWPTTDDDRNRTGGNPLKD